MLVPTTINPEKSIGYGILICAVLRCVSAMHAQRNSSTSCTRLFAKHDKQGNRTVKLSEQISTVCRLVIAHGTSRFDERSAFKALWPSKDMSWNRLVGFDARPYMAELVSVGVIAYVPSPRGGLGWAVTAAGMAKAKGHAAKQDLGFQQQFERRIAATL